MSGPPSLIASVRAALQPHGLFLRGSLRLADEAPPLSDGTRAKTVLLVGQIGGSLWPSFSRWQKAEGPNAAPDPLDRWSKSILAPLARDIGATACFPSDPPYQPFQQWAMRAEGLKASPLGILIHPEYGLWHGYRGALAFRHVPDGFEETTPAATHPCDSCVTRPCLQACPVGAILPEGFQYEPCRRFLGTKRGRICHDNGCLARNACPVGASYRYPQDQIRFHMAALKTL